MTIELHNLIPGMLVPTKQRADALAAILKRHMVGEPDAWWRDRKALRLAWDLIETGDLQALCVDLGKAPDDPDIRREIAAEIETEVLAAQEAQEERELDARINEFFSPTIN